MRRWLNERGDTLVEVTIAFAILTMVLMASFRTADRAFQLGQTARERSALINVAQQQAEALKTFRDSHTWAQFVYGSPGAPTGGFNYTNCSSSSLVYCGVSNRNDPGLDCSSTEPGEQKCFHMKLRDIQESGVLTKEWVPVPDTDDVAAGGGVAIESIDTDPGVGAPHVYDFAIHYAGLAIGSSDRTNQGDIMRGSFTQRLVELDALR